MSKSEEQRRVEEERERARRETLEWHRALARERQASGGGRQR